MVAKKKINNNKKKIKNKNNKKNKNINKILNKKNIKKNKNKINLPLLSKPKTNVLVSVIIPTYNCKDYILKAIQSVMYQTYTLWEIIVVDDCSTDDSKNIIEGFIKMNQLENKVKYYCNEKNCGTYVTINNGILKSKGDYITLLGSDDIYDINKLKKQVSILNKYNVIAVKGYYKRENIIKKDNEVTMMFRRKVLKEIGYFDSLRFAADSEFTERLTKIYGKNMIYIIPLVLYHAINRTDSLTNNPNTKLGSKVRKKYVQRYRKWHSKNKKLYIPFPQPSDYVRPFKVHKSMLPNRNTDYISDDSGSNSDSDSVIISENDIVNYTNNENNTIKNDINSNQDNNNNDENENTNNFIEIKNRIKYLLKDKINLI